MNIAQAILEMYPGLDPTRDFEVRDDGQGPYLASWNNPTPRPTQAQLEAAWFRVVKRLKRAELANRMHRENRALYPEVQEVEGAWVAEAMIDLATEPRGVRIATIRANRDKRARGYAAVEAAATVALVEAVKWETL